MIELGPEICRAVPDAGSREWLETNGLGGYASSTVAGMNTRRYHGLLVASLRPPVERYVLLSHLEETLEVDGQAYELGCNQYPGVVHPQGYELLSGFRLDPFPVFTYQAGGLTLEKSLWMVHGENTTVIRFRILEAPPGARVRLRVRPVVAFRDHHSLTHENGALDPRVQTEPGQVIVAPYPGLPPLRFAHDAASVDETGWWFRSFEYAVERERGLDWTEDLFSPFELSYELNGGEATLIASLDRHEAGEAVALADRERFRRKGLLDTVPTDDSLFRALSRAADQFLVERGAGQTIIAGYHWFTDWGRDTMIALPGLTLATGRAEVARGILQEFARHVDRGMLPNRFPDGDEEPEYNTVDATLWYFEAVRSYGAYTGDYAFIREHLYPVLAEIVEWHVRGTRHGIRVDADGLLLAGEEGVQLTWMDAKIGDWVVTPRHGKPVEVQALWYNALRTMVELSERFQEPSRVLEYAGLAARACRSFREQFWYADGGYLYDCITGHRKDPSLRPNQVLAVSLHHSMVSRERARQVVEVVRRELLTPRGLRSLSPHDPRYTGRYEGSPRDRDSTYHQGAVWGWLIGPFITAYVRANGGTRRARFQAAEWLEPFREHLKEAGLGQVSELFDGDPPHTPRGCITQAWSVGELLRALREDLLGKNPAASQE